MPVYDEAAYENALIDLFTNTLGHTHVYGPDIERDWHSPLYDSVLEDSIRRLNPSAAPAAIDEALLKLRHFENAELKKKNALWSDTIKVQCLNCRKTKEYCNEKVRSKFQGRGIKALRRHWNQEGLRTA